MNIRYQKNLDSILTKDIQNKLLNTKVAVIGCGAQGSYILDYLIRLGVNSIVFWDGDNYSESNLNRQLGCTEKTIGQNKAKVQYERLKEINSSTNLIIKDYYFGDNYKDYDELLKVNCIFLAADYYYNISKIRELLRQAILQDIPVIDCPAKSFGGLVYIETKNDLGHFDYETMRSIEQSKNTKSEELQGQTAYVCALIAAEAVNQFVLYIANSRFANIDSGLEIDLYHHKYKQFDRFGYFN